MFYSKLYTSHFSDKDCIFLFSSIAHLIPQINKTFDAQLQIEELDAAVKKMALNKSPGSDGLLIFINPFGRI